MVYFIIVKYFLYIFSLNVVINVEKLLKWKLFLK